ncbi:MAG: ATP-binding protein [Thermoanaerobaculia bacterium]|nr:ATP-binding protein [Thermoanaerobaculia bacterium]
MTSRLAQPATWPLRWRYAAGAFLLGVVYSLAALVLGVEATFRGLDVTLWVGGVVEASFAVFGYLLGLNAEARLRERRNAQVIETQLRDLAAARSRLARSERLAALGELAGAIVHEVRNPLAIIRSMAQNLEEALEDEASETSGQSEALELCRQIRDEVDRVARVTASLSAFSRRPTLHRRRVDVDRLVSRVALLATELLDERKLELRLVSAEADGVCLHADEDLLTQVLLGLVQNAVTVSPEGGVIELGWNRREEFLEMTVSDEGPGVPPDLLESIFDPFVTTRSEGQGLGLAVARQIVLAHGGDIRAETAPDAGAVFRLRVPVSDLEPPVEATE